MIKTLQQKTLLIITNRLNIGGVAKDTLFIADVANQAFRSVSIIPLGAHSKNDMPGHKIRIITLNNRQSREGNILKRLIRNNFTVVRELRDRIKVESPDVICALASDVCFRAMLATIGLKVKVVCSERGDPRDKHYLWKVIVRWAYKRCDCVVFQTIEVEELFQRDVKDSVVIPIQYQPVGCSEPYYGPRDHVVTSTGRFDKTKNYPLLIKAFAKVIERFPDFKLIIYGEGILRKEYEKLIASMGLKDNVELPGYVSDVGSAIRKAAVFVMSSDHEGIPNSLMEAMALGVPVVSTDFGSGGAKLLTKDGTRGLLVPTGDVEAMSNAIIHILEDPELSSRLSLNALEVKCDFSPQVVGKQWLEVFHRVIQK